MNNNKAQSVFQEFIDVYGVEKSSYLLERYKAFVGFSREYNKAKELRAKFLLAVESLEKTEKHLQVVTSLVSKDKPIKDHIFKMAELYIYLEDQMESLNPVLDICNKDTQGPKNLYVLMLSKILKVKGSSRIDWEAMRNVIIQLKTFCSVVSTYFDSIEVVKKKDPYDNEQAVKQQKEILRSAYNRAKNYKSLKL